MLETFRRQGRRALRLSRRSVNYGLALCGAAGVALLSLLFAWLAETALAWNKSWTQAAPWAAFFILPCAAAALRWLTMRLAPMARGSGIPQVIAATELHADLASSSGLVSLRQSLWKILLTAAALLAGVSAGREGPSVQVGAAAMLAWRRLCLRLGVRARFHANELIAAGAAGGLAAAFNTPLAGVVFAIEELGRGSAVRWNRLALSAVLASGFIALALAGDSPYFRTAAGLGFASSSWGWTIACALANGACGGLFAATLLRGPTGMVPSAWAPWLKARPLGVAFACGLLVAALGYATHGATYGTGYEASAALLDGQPVSPWFGAAKWLATAASYMAGIPGGIFTPALAIGAGIGQHIVQWASPAIEPRTIALLSMAAFLAAATQAPITASVIVMEMTRSQNLMFHLLVATLLASLVSRVFCPKPFYHAMALRFQREAVAARRSGTG